MGFKLNSLRLITLDPNVFISKIKGDEPYSNECGILIERVGIDFFLVEPTIMLTEIGNAVGRNIGLREAEEEIEIF